VLSTACIDALHSAFNEGGKSTTAEQGLRESVLEAVGSCHRRVWMVGFSGTMRYVRSFHRQLPVAPPLNRLHARGESGPRPGRRAAPRRAAPPARGAARRPARRGPGPTPLRPRETFTMRDVCTPSFR